MPGVGIVIGVPFDKSTSIGGIVYGTFYPASASMNQKSYLLHANSSSYDSSQVLGLTQNVKI